MRSDTRGGRQFVGILQLCFLLLESAIALQQYYAYSWERDGDLGVEYKQVVDHSVQYVWRYSYDTRNRSQVPGDTFRVDTQVEPGSAPEFPVIFEVRHLHHPVEWRLPGRSGSGRLYHTASRTLCSDPGDNLPSKYGYQGDTLNTVQVTVTTRSRTPVPFSVKIVGENNTLKSFGESVRAQVTPSSPLQYRLAMPQHVLSARYSLLYLSSSDNVCCTVSILHSPCTASSNPVDSLDAPRVLRSQLTMTRKAAINLKREDLASGHLLLVVTMHDDNGPCGLAGDEGHPLLSLNNRTFSRRSSNTTAPGPWSKSLELTLLPKIGDDVYLFATAATFLSLLVFCVGFAFLFWARFRMVSVITLNQRRPPGVPCGGSSLPPNRHPITTIPSALSVPGLTPNEKGGVREEDLCCLFFLVTTSQPKPGRHKRYLQDNCQKCSRDITKSTRRYVSTLSVIGAFYILPVLQFVLLYQQVLNETGNEDLCYYNFLCLHPLGNVTTFNHMFSNIGYVMLGVLFIGIVHVEQKRQWGHGDPDKNEEESAYQPAERGLHSHYGIFYAMGIALAMEGLMSAFYHICPNRLNYQFDMCFMYVTTMLCLVKLYQGRHPDSNVSALMSYGSLALLVLLVAAGVLFQTWYFWCVIMLIHFSVVFVMSLHLYSLGEWRIGSWPALTKTENVSYYLSSFCLPFRGGCGWLTFFLVFLNLSNWFAAGLGYFLFYTIQDFASHFVFILLINLLLYSLIYLFLKIRYRERILWPTWLYVGLSIPFWFIGLYLFLFRRVDGWHLTQAESRSLNEECILLDFYDWHDIWHFLSAFGIFFMFMFFFTIDDDLRNVRRTNIKVF